MRKIITKVRRVDRLKDREYKLELDIDYQLLTLKEAMDVGDGEFIKKIKNELESLIEEREWLRKEIKKYNQGR